MENKKFRNFYRWLFFTAFLPYLAYIFPEALGAIAGFNITGWAWLLMLFVASYYMVTLRVKRSFPLFFWLPWVAYLLFSLAVDFSFYGLQLTLQYMLPVIVGFVASGFSYDKEMLHWLYTNMLLLCGVIAILFIVGFVFSNGYTPFAAFTPMMMAVMAAISIGAFYITKQIRFLIVYALLFLIPFFDVTRMAMLVFMFILIMHFANRNIIYKTLFGTVGVLLALFVFNSKGFQEKTFFSGVGQLSDLESNINYYDENSIFNSSGRARFFKYYENGLKAEPIFGNGPRADLRVLESIVDTGFSEAHNDYISVRYNYGYVGLGFLLFGFLATFISLYSKFMNEKNMYKMLLQSSALTLTLGLLMAMYSENMLKSTVFFTDFYFALLGMVFGSFDNKTES
jgi:hypothetical protein